MIQKKKKEKEEENKIVGKVNKLFLFAFSNYVYLFNSSI